MEIRSKKLLVAPGITTSNKKLLVKCILVKCPQTSGSQMNSTRAFSRKHELSRYLPSTTMVYPLKRGVNLGSMCGQ